MKTMGLIFLCPLLCLTSCASHTKNERLGSWKQSALHTGSYQFNSGRLSYNLPHPNNAIELQIFRIEKEYKGYLCLHRKKIPTQTEQIPITLIIENTTTKYLAEKHQGGQKVILPLNALQEILQALENKTDVLLSIAGYQLILSHQGFSSEYEKLKTTSHLPPLIQMPF